MTAPLLELEGTWEEILAQNPRLLWPKTACPSVSCDRK